MSKSQQPMVVDVPEKEAQSGEVEWYRRGCASFDKLAGGLQKSRLGSMRAVLINADRLWAPGETITATFVNQRGTAIQQEKVKKVLEEWYKYANVEFKFIQQRNATIRISFDEDEGSWSYVAKDNLHDDIPRAQSTMNYGWVTRGKEVTAEDRSVILHEFGHCIGFLHEHQSSRRGETLTLDENAVLQFYMRTQGWSEEQVRQQILSVYDDKEVSSFSKLDLTSIMMYFMPAEMNKERIEVPPNNDLSDMDKAHAMINYPYFANSPRKNLQDPKWSFSRALDVAGVSGDSRTAMEAAYAKGDFNEIRTEFSLFSLNQRALALAGK